MSMRGQISMRATHESSTRTQEAVGSSLSVAALALVLILLVAVTVTFAPAPLDPIPTGAEWLIGP